MLHHCVLVGWGHLARKGSVTFRLTGAIEFVRKYQCWPVLPKDSQESIGQTHKIKTYRRRRSRSSWGIYERRRFSTPKWGMPRVLTRGNLWLRAEATQISWWSSGGSSPFVSWIIPRCATLQRCTWVCCGMLYKASACSYIISVVWSAPPQKKYPPIPAPHHLRQLLAIAFLKQLKGTNRHEYYIILFRLLQ